MKSRNRFQERKGIFLNCERAVHDLARYLKLTDTEAYTFGVMQYAAQFPEKCTEEQLHSVIQFRRVRMQEDQDITAHLERVAFDIHVKNQTRRQQKTVTIKDDLGQEILAVYAK